MINQADFVKTRKSSAMDCRLLAGCRATRYLLLPSTKGSSTIGWAERRR